MRNTERDVTKANWVLQLIALPVSTPSMSGLKTWGRGFVGHPFDGQRDQRMYAMESQCVIRFYYLQFIDIYSLFNSTL